MAVQVSTARQGKSVGAGAVGVVVTLLVFVAVFIGFLLAPLVVLLLAFLAWSVAGARGERSAPPAPGPRSTDEATLHGFGTGAR
ncbi:hypothetical protein I601_0712 [Nocardioides dokdonensis FR1436]|uniref:Uncharacterized protein n=1 Tax=Nocardioides dokdonensis FR1436 TaxID=1300347 RepID=A0A1A9GHP7_9ACTN|nr:hypothetical protein [Nocardioides dokdonensis]ANH37162.1 hypothetical protein I601_0712 [Nocardioides dokdonensis FR1436]